MNDLISRQAAIEVVHKSIFDFFDICDDDEELPMTYKDELLLELNKAITTQIKAVETVEAVPKEDYMGLRIASQKIFDSFTKRLKELEERLNAIDIHCIDCKHHEDEEPGMVYCPNIVGGWVNNNFYCGYAKRKESERMEIDNV